MFPRIWFYLPLSLFLQSNDDQIKIIVEKFKRQKKDDEPLWAVVQISLNPPYCEINAAPPCWGQKSVYLTRRWCWGRWSSRSSSCPVLLIELNSARRLTDATTSCRQVAMHTKWKHSQHFRSQSEDDKARELEQNLRDQPPVWWRTGEMNDVPAWVALLVVWLPNEQEIERDRGNNNNNNNVRLVTRPRTWLIMRLFLISSSDVLFEKSLIGANFTEGRSPHVIIFNVKRLRRRLNKIDMKTILRWYLCTMTCISMPMSCLFVVGFCFNIQHFSLLSFTLLEVFWTGLGVQLVGSTWCQCTGCYVNDRVILWRKLKIFKKLLLLFLFLHFTSVITEMVNFKQHHQELNLNK